MPKTLFPLPGLVLCASALLTLSCGVAGAQNSDFDLDLHANSHVTAKDVGLPVYPGAQLYKDKDKDDSSAADLGFALNAFHVGLKVVAYTTDDSPTSVLGFYRKSLASYGQVLECRNGKPVGSLTVTRSGLTCSDKKDGKGITVNGDSDRDHELRAGTPLRYRVVSVADEQKGSTRFDLLFIELPKESPSASAER